ncbi:MAG: hypothetical protein IPG04_41885 [Polyangiaceae bacterium]|nr:hypothetical protein [Polyangiaceae bacterium]
MLLVAYDLSGAPKRAFYPQNGTFVLEEIGLDFPSYVVGSASDMELVEVIQNRGLHLGGAARRRLLLRRVVGLRHLPRRRRRVLERRAVPQ